MDKQDLIDFEKEVVEGYKKGETYGPVHLGGSTSGVLEDKLIKMFKYIKKNDWVFTTHRSHYHALLKSKDKKWLMKEILDGYSPHINSYKYKIFSSCIVGGHIPIALGLALAIKLKKQKKKVYCFVGDMAGEMGCFSEALKYAMGFDLPIKFAIENNGIGCETPTEEVWRDTNLNYRNNKMTEVHYNRIYPHYGIAGGFVKLKKGGESKFGMYG